MQKPFLHSDILVHFLEGSCSTSFTSKIGKDSSPSVLFLSSLESSIKRSKSEVSSFQSTFTFAPLIKRQGFSGFHGDSKSSLLIAGQEAISTPSVTTN